MGFRQIRLDINDLIIARYDNTMIAHHRVGIPPIVVGFHQLILLVYLLSGFGIRPIFVGFRKIRLESDRLVVVRDGFTIILQVSFDNPPFVVGFHQLILLVYLLSGIRPIFVGFRIIRLESDRLVVVRDSFTIIPQASFDNPPFVVGFRH